MSMQTDVLSASLSSSGAVTSTRTRVKGLVITPGTTAGSVNILDGSSTGTSKINIVTVAAGQSFYVEIPGEGVLFYNGVYATLTNATVVVFYA
ncbi:MAG: hypothetical protein KGI88_07960 [Betaproteobacteria bacterium]|nr:hypothetical protein [Betaproteobacteria bacterium]